MPLVVVSCIGCYRSDDARQPISIAAPVASCCNPITSCDSRLAHSWVVGVRSGFFAADSRSCRSTQTRAGCCRFTSPSSFFVWPSMPRLTPNWAISTFADLQSTMSNQRWASLLVLSPIPSMPLDSKTRLWGCTLRPALPSVTGSYMVARCSTFEVPLALPPCSARCKKPWHRLPEALLTSP